MQKTEKYNNTDIFMKLLFHVSNDRKHAGQSDLSHVSILFFHLF